MNTDEKSCESRAVHSLSERSSPTQSVFICVHPWFRFCSSISTAGARFTSLALGYSLSGFQPFRFEPRDLGCYGCDSHYDPSKFCQHARILAAKERKEHKEKPFHLCDLCVLLRPSSSVAAPAAPGSFVVLHLPPQSRNLFRPYRACSVCWIVDPGRRFALPWAIIFRAFSPFGLSLVISASTVRFVLGPSICDAEAEEFSTPHPGPPRCCSSGFRVSGSGLFGLGTRNFELGT